MTSYGYDVDPDETDDIPLRSGALEESFLLQPIGRLMQKKVSTLTANLTVLDAARKMTLGRYGCILVVDDDGIMEGIFTERDLMTRVVAAGLDPSTALIGEHMTANPEFLHVEDQMAYALHMMAVGNFRHVPIVDEQLVPVGIFSVRDLQKEVVGHFEKDILTLPPKPVHQGPHRRHAG